jgi:Ca2+-binding EF-hand superfamily protein
MTLDLSFSRGAMLAAVCLVGVSTASAQNRGQFRGLDQNGDGVITRAEWRGNDRSFFNHDRNRDGVITREEWRITENVRGGAWTAQDFDVLDRNDDQRLTRYEWRSDYGVFDTVDRNRDGVITREEWRFSENVRGGRGAWTAQDFDVLDRNDDQRLTRYEWRSGYGVFDTVDRNRDGVVTRNEFLDAREPAPAAFNPSSQDGRYNEGRQGPGARAYQAGRNRGLEEGRQAGRDDRNRGRWDLDGQRELMRADSGYRSDFGDHDIYQAGYREGFMSGYREAFGPGAPRQGRAYELGRAQGMVDGRNAGRQDGERRHWDLEGQRELVMADAGYREGIGSRSEYEWGYREGFRVGYEQGFGPQR